MPVEEGASGYPPVGSFKIRLGESIRPTGQVSFHALRYNFEPDSMDKMRGHLLIDSAGEAHLSFPNGSKAGEEYCFRGSQMTGKDNDFVLIFDPEAKEFVLERQETTLLLRNMRPAKQTSQRQRQRRSESVNTGKTSGPEAEPSFLPPEATDDGEFSDLENMLLEDLEKS